MLLWLYVSDILATIHTTTMPIAVLDLPAVDRLLSAFHRGQARLFRARIGDLSASWTPDEGLVAATDKGIQQAPRKLPSPPLQAATYAFRDVATWEREIMLERQRDGIAKAKKKENIRAVRLRSTPLRSGD